MNTPALFITIAVVLYAFMQIGVWLTWATAMSGKFTKFSVSMNVPFVMVCLGLGLAYAADTYL